MALVNKFNVNKQQVTLDADIIENMSANDVSYNDSFQYDENTVGNKLNKLSELEKEVIYDVTANNDGATFASLSALLSDENLSTLIPTSVRHGGMTIRFIQSSDNKYVQYRLMSTSFSTNEVNWQDAEQIPFEAELNSVLTIKKGGYWNGVYVDNIKRVHTNLIKTPFSVSLNNGYKFSYIQKFSRDVNGNLIYIEQPSYSSTSTLNIDRNNYVYILSISKSDDNQIIEPSEYHSIISSFKGEIDTLFDSFNSLSSTISSLVTNVEQAIDKTQKIGTYLEKVPNNDWDDITSMQDGGNSIFANLYRVSQIFGFQVKVTAACTLKYGIVKYTTGHESIELGTIQVPNPGLNTIYLANNVTLNDDEYFYIVPVLNSVHIYRINTNGVGMIEGNHDIAYPSWEMAYSVIYEIPEQGTILYQFHEIEEQIEQLSQEVKEVSSSAQIGDIKYGEIIIPTDIYIAKKGVNLNDGVNGVCECNLFWDNIANVDNQDKSIYFDTYSTIGKNLDRCYRIAENNVGNYTLKIDCRNSHNRKILSSKTLNIHIVDNTAGVGNKNILMIGDSRHVWYKGNQQGESNANSGSDGLAITMKVKELLAANSGAMFNFLGTKISDVDSSVKNLSQSGWQISSAINAINAAGGINQYIEQSCGAGTGASLDFCTFMFGVNDIMYWTSMDNGMFDSMTNKINGVISNAVSLVNLIHTGYPNCKIIVVLESTTCGTQNGFGYYGGTISVQQRIETEYALKAYRKSLITEFSKEIYSSYVTLSSAGLWCDRIFGFPYYHQSVSARTSKEQDINLDCVHPHNEGMFQIADGIYSTILAILN